MANWSETWTWLDGDWHEGNVLVAGPRTHAFWLGSSVFDGARAFEGVTPDLDRHCERLNRSANAMGLKPTECVETMLGLTRDGMKKFDAKADSISARCTGPEHGALAARPADPRRRASACASTSRR